MTLTDGKIYDPTLKPYEVRGDRSGTLDDRFVFTSRFSAAGVMQDIVSLAAAYPALKDYYPEEAERSLKNAKMLWEKHFDDADPAKNPVQGRWGGFGGDPRLNAAIELWIATGDKQYKDFIVPIVEKQLDAKPTGPRDTGNVQNGMFSTQFIGGPNLTAALKIYPYMDKKFQAKVRALVPAYVEVITRGGQDNPYGVSIGQLPLRLPSVQQRLLRDLRGREHEEGRLQQQPRGLLRHPRRYRPWPVGEGGFLREQGRLSVPLG